MSSVIKLALPVELLSLVRLAHLLQGVEHQTVDPHQYRLLVEKLSAELSLHQANPALPTLLDHFPAASELYENLQYAHAGLCRAPLEASLQSELAARELLVRISR